MNLRAGLNAVLSATLLGACIHCSAGFAQADILVSNEGGSGTVARFDESTKTSLGAFAQLVIPSGMAVGNDGGIYINDYDVGTITKYNSAGQSQGIVAYPGQYAVSLAVRPNNDLFVGSINFYSSGQGAVLKLNAANPFGSFFVPPHSNGMDLPEAIVFGSDNNLYVASLDSGDILRFNGTTGAFIDTFVSAANNGAFPDGLSFGPNGDLYVSSYLDNEILRFDSSGNSLGVFASGGGLDGPTGLKFGPDGDLYVVSNRNNSVLRYDGSTGAFLDTVIASDSGLLSSPFDIVFVPEPSTIVLAAIGVTSLAAVSRRRA